MIWFHSGLPSFAGFYASVDVFFVISGYLIAGHVQRDLERGHFSLSAFYQRRVRRIAPGLLAALGLTLLAGYALLLPEALEELARESLAALGMVPNLFYWIEAPNGYFEAIKHSPPLLLHTWTLGIEEQFYLLFPLFLLAAYKLRASRWAIAAVVVLSFALGAVVANRAPVAAFYLLPTRAWELAAGALFSAGRFAIPPRFRPATSLIGITAILAAFVLLDETARFAALLLALPVAGAALVIGSGASALANRLLTFAPLVWTGRISYSLYLLHWPVLVLLQSVQSSGRLSPLLALTAIGTTIALAAISFAWIEQPPRRREVPFRRVAIATLLGLAIVLALAIVPLLARGLPGRFSPQVLTIAAQSKDRAPLARKCVGIPLERIETDCRIGGGAATALIWGDSHAAAESAGIADGLGQSAVLAAMGGCAPGLAAATRTDRCAQKNRAVLAWLKSRPEIATVVLVGNWPAHIRAGEARLSADLQSAVAALPGRRLIIITGTPEPRIDMPSASAMRAHLGLAPIRLRCPSHPFKVKGATILDLSAAYCVHPEPWMLFTDANHPSLTANREVIAPELQRMLNPRL